MPWWTNLNIAASWLVTASSCAAQGCQPVFTKKSQTLSQQKPDSSFKALPHKTYLTKHKTDVRTHQKHSYNTIPLFRSIYLPRIYTVVHLFLMNQIDHFCGNSKIFSIFWATCVVTDSFQKRFVINMQTIFPEPSLSDCKKNRASQILSGFFWFPTK